MPPDRQPGARADRFGVILRSRRAPCSRLLVSEGFATSLPEAAIRFAIAHPAIGTIQVGMASVEEFEGTLAAVLKGPSPVEALRRVAELTATEGP